MAINYVYGALLLHSAGKPIDEHSLKKLVEAAGEKPEDVQIKALVTGLEGVNIEEAIKSAAVAVAAPSTAAPAAEKKEEKSEEEEKKKAEEAVAGLGSLFG